MCIMCIMCMVCMVCMICIYFITTDLPSKYGPHPVADGRLLDWCWRYVVGGARVCVGALVDMRVCRCLVCGGARVRAAIPPHLTFSRSSACVVAPLVASLWCSMLG